MKDLHHESRQASENFNWSCRGRQSFSDQFDHCIPSSPDQSGGGPQSLESGRNKV